MSKMFKKASAKPKRNNKSSPEDKWFCLVVVVLVVLIAFVIQQSMSSANEKFLKSDYHIQLNNLLYDLQGSNQTALLVTFKPKNIKKTINQTTLFKEAFNDAKNRTKFHQLNYEIIKTMKSEVLARLYITVENDKQEDINTTVYSNLYDNFIKTLKKSKKVLTIEYRNFDTQINPRQRSYYMSGKNTKSRETLDYKVRFHHGRYLYIDPILKNVTAEITEQLNNKLQLATEIIDDSPDDVLLVNDQNVQQNQESTLNPQQRIVLNKYEKLNNAEVKEYVNRKEDKQQRSKYLCYLDQSTVLDYLKNGIQIQDNHQNSEKKSGGLQDRNIQQEL